MSVVLAGYARTPFARFTGALASVPAVRLGATAISAALTCAGLDPAEVDRVIAGQVLQGAAGQNPARQAAVAAGIPLTVPALTLNAVCLSGTEAVAAAAALIRAGEAEVVVAVGMESMSLAPHAWSGSRAGARYGAVELVDTLENDGLTNAFEHRSMGASTEDGNHELGLDRIVQDAWAASSHQRAAAAHSALAAEIAPVEITGRRPTTVSVDDGIRPDTTAESLAALRPAFRPDGTITAGNASQITDGAAAVVLMSAQAAARRGVGLATIEAHALVAGPDVRLHAQPASAIRTALGRGGWTPADLHAVEINEAFAAVAVHSTELLDVDPGLVNRWGGAIALGHPIGASGARIVGTLARQLVALRDAGQDGALGAAGICGGGGQGSALVLRVLG